MSSNYDKYEIRKLDPGEFDLWDRFISEHPYGTLFHTSCWADLIKKVFKRDFQIVGLLHQQNLLGGVIHGFKTFPAIKAIPQSPLTPYQGILLKSAEAEKTSSRIAREHELTTILLNELKNQFAFIDMTLMNNISDVRPYQWQSFSAEANYTYTFILSEFNHLKKQFSQALRRKINVSEKDEHQVIHSSDCTALLKFITDSYRHHRLAPPVPESHLKLLITNCIENKLGQLFYLLLEEKPVAGIFLLEDQKRVYAFFSGMDQRFRDSQFSEYLHAFVLQQPQFIGREFDFLGANTHSFDQFKRSFGGQLRLYFRVKFFKNRSLAFMSKLREKHHLISRNLPGIF